MLIPKAAVAEKTLFSLESEKSIICRGEQSLACQPLHPYGSKMDAESIAGVTQGMVMWC